MDAPHKNKRQLILDTALDIIESAGMKALTQPRIARNAKLRQSNLTYYFPRKADLYIALLEASHERAEASNADTASSLREMLSSLFFSPERMRFFLSIVLEVGDDADLKRVMSEHASGLSREVASRLCLPADDARVHAFIDELRGVGIRVLIEPELSENAGNILQDMARRHNIDPHALR